MCWIVAWVDVGVGVCGGHSVGAFVWQIAAAGDLILSGNAVPRGIAMSVAAGVAAAACGIILIADLW